MGEKSHHESFMCTSYGLDGAGPFIKTRESMHSSAVHATEWPSSTLHALSMRTSFLHFIKSRSASTSFTANILVRHLFPINTIHIKHSIKVNIIVGKYPVFILSIHYMNFSFYWTTCYRSERWIQESGHVTRWGVSKASHMITCTISSHVHHIHTRRINAYYAWYSVGTFKWGPLSWIIQECMQGI